MNTYVREGNLEWGRDPSAMVWMTVLTSREEIFLLVLPEDHVHHRRQIPEWFKFIDTYRLTLRLPNPYDGTTAPTQSNSYAVYLVDVRRMNRTIGGSTSCSANHPVFHLGSGYCYLCFPPVGHVLTESIWTKDNTAIWNWGEKYVAYGKSLLNSKSDLLPEYDFVFNPKEYNRIVANRKEFDFCKRQTARNLGQALLHFAACEATRQFRCDGNALDVWQWEKRTGYSSEKPGPGNVALSCTQ